jgi:RNA polymerase sigma factor (sigma-70 family)
MEMGSGGIATLVARPVRELTDHELVSAVRHGDDAAFEELYERYLGRITAFVQGMVKDHGRAEDVAQEVFMSALRRMRETERPIAFKPWIYEIARNACIDQHRRSSRTEEISYDAEHTLGGSDHGRLAATGPSPDAAVVTKQQLDHLCGAFGGLSESHHEILVLRELEGLSYREIGDRMSLSRPAVESTLFRARRRLSEEYEDLASGRRCERVQAIIAAAAEGMLGARDHRRLARHVSYCQSCRQHARLLGVREAKPARGIGARIAALLPVPAFLRGQGGRDVAAGSSASHSSATLAQWSAGAGTALEPIATGWGKAAATVATMAIVGVGAGVSSHSGAITLLDGARSHPAGVHAAGRHTPSAAPSGPATGVTVGEIVRQAAPAVRRAAISRSAGTRSTEIVRPVGAHRSDPLGHLRSVVPLVGGERRVSVPGLPDIHVTAVPGGGRENGSSSGSDSGISVPASVTEPRVAVEVPDVPPPADPRSTSGSAAHGTQSPAAPPAAG